MDGFMKNLLKG